MSPRVIQFFVCCCACVPASGVALAQNVRMFWVPQGGNRADYPSGPTVVQGIPGQQLCMELHVQSLTGSDFVSSFAAVLLAADQVGSSGGCASVDCTTVAIDRARPDDAGWAINLALCGQCPPFGENENVNWNRASLNPPFASLSSAGNYFGEVCLKVGPSMCGQVIIDYIGAPAADTQITNAAGQPELDAVFDPLVIVVNDCQEAPSGPVRLFWVPQDGDPADYLSGPSMIDALPGDRVCMELWIQGVCAEYFAQSVTATVQDRSSTGITGSVMADCSSAAVDMAHPAYPGFSVGSVYRAQCGDAGTMDRIGWFLWIDFMGVSLPIAGSPGAAYLAEVCYDVSGDAKGQFVIDYLGVPAETHIYGNGAGMWCEDDLQLDAVFDPLVINVADCHADAHCPPSDADVCTADRCIAGTCVNQPNLYGDVDGNGSHTLADVFCILEGFAGDFANCSFEQDDIHGLCGTGLPKCCPNGSIGLGDIFAFLDAFTGIDPCCGG